MDPKEISVNRMNWIERRVSGYVHIRKGPNKVGFIGILQPFRDAIKLFSGYELLEGPCECHTEPPGSINHGVSYEYS